MTALPRKPVLLTLPRATRLYRTCTLVQLAAMPLVDLDVALAALWKRIDELRRPIPAVTRAVDHADFMQRSIKAAALVAVLEPLPKPTAAQRKVMDWKQQRRDANTAAEIDSAKAEDAAYREFLREDARAEFEDWRDGSTARSLVDRFRDPPTRPEEF